MDFNIVADIRTNDKGKDILYHDDFKFRKNNINPKSTSWVCCKRGSLNCKATASTKDFNGVAMMKLNVIGHIHDPEFD